VWWFLSDDARLGLSYGQQVAVSPHLMAFIGSCCRLYREKEAVEAVFGGFLA